MQGSDGRSVSQFFDALSLPSIHTLQIDLNSNHFPRASFVSLINRSSCSVTRLVLSSVLILDVHLLQCLRAVPCLRTLELRFVEITTRRFHMLDPKYAPCFSYTGQLFPGNFHAKKMNRILHP